MDVHLRVVVSAVIVSIEHCVPSGVGNDARPLVVVVVVVIVVVVFDTSAFHTKI